MASSDLSQDREYGTNKGGLSNKELLRLLYAFVTPQEKRTLAAAW